MNALIVDDERWTSEGLRDTVPWADLGIDSVRIADHAAAALTAAREAQPHVVICDVRMPSIDGLTFAEQLQTVCPSSQVIFISGYTEKDYLKRAIGLKAIEYLEKPLRLDEVADAIRKAVRTVEEAEEERRAFELITTQLADTIPLARARLAVALAHGSVREWSPALEASIGATRAAATRACVSIVISSLGPNGASGREAIRSTPWDAVESGIAEAARRAGLDASVHLCGQIEPNRRVIQLLSSTEIDPVRLRLEIINDFEPYRGLHICIGRPVSSPPELHSSFESASRTLWEAFYDGEGVSLWSSRSGGRFEMTETLSTEFRMAIDRRDYERAKRLVSNVRDEAARARDGNTASVLDAFFALISTLYEARLESAGYKQEGNSILWTSILSLPTLKQIAAHVEEELDFFAAVQSGTQTRELSPASLRAKGYIDDHYAERINLEEIAAEAFVAPSHLCLVFREAMGQTVHEYLTEVRMAHAKRLLKHTTLTNHEIATKSGYSESNYFSKAFKRFTGCSPSEYREKEGQR